MEKIKIIDKCIGCNRVDGEFCSVYINPSAKWASIGNCPLATNIEKKEVAAEKKINPLKASKKMKGKK